MNNSTTQLVFGSQRIVETEDELATLLERPSKAGKKSEVPRFQSRNEQSPYVSVFEDIANQIYDFESNLLSKEEEIALAAFRKLSYPSRYILIRLALRKPGWHTRKSLSKYVSEVGDHGIDLAAKELCVPVSEILQRDNKLKVKTKDVKMEEVDVKVEVEVKVDANDIIDLTEDSDNEDVTEPSPSCSPIALPPEAQYFCQNQTHMTLDEALARLSVDEVKGLNKDCKVKAQSNTKDALILALKSHAQSQGNLSAMMHSQGKQYRLRQTQLDFGAAFSSLITQEGRLQCMAVKKLGSCLRVNPKFQKLLRRLDIIFYRSTSIPETFFLNSFLTVFKKRVYPTCTSARSTIWPTRDAYLDYEEGLKLQAIFDLILDDTIVRPKGSAPPTGLNTEFRTPISSRTNLTNESFKGAVKSKLDETPMGLGNDFKMVDLTVILSADSELGEDNEDTKPKANPEKLFAAKRVIEIYHLVLKPKWDLCISEVQLEEERDPSLERFEQGYILTRLLWKVTEAYALLHKYDDEFQVLQLLLNQRIWRQAKRGKWYERRALVQDRHLPTLYRSRAEQNGWTRAHLHNKKQALLGELREGLYEAMEDKDTHRVYHKSLVKRLTKVESRMKLPFASCHVYTVQLRDATDVCVFAHRAENTPWTIERSQNWKDKAKVGVITDWLIRDGFAYACDESEGVDDAVPKRPSSTGKSVWKTLDGSSTCNVETRALQYYAQEERGGYKGFHSETCILTTIFALLFWDIIFADIPGAFETRYQIAPLDLVEDSFYHARKEMIESRLKELKEGKALKILDRHDKLYRESKTWCVGVRWDVCGKEDLVEIVECMGGDALVVICELFCHDYPARASGVPDLIVWNYQGRKCKFVEVKGPGDRARDNQTVSQHYLSWFEIDTCSGQLWFDTLLGAGLDVDLCRVLDHNTKNVNAEKEKRDQRIAKEEKARIKKEKEEKVGQRKGRKAKRKGSDSGDDELNMDVNPDDEADFRGPDNMYVWNSSAFNRGKRRRLLGDSEDDLDILKTSQDKVVYEDSELMPPPKRLKTGEGDPC
ncbi:hypothetical protein J3R30DRAFT_3484850 [Lentinula aciculospora]|uniref:Fanconi-associated nuclease n=1 Tax=Lentinula aciculospora TaxID=153920 RepID=A0A9W9A8Z8_9AGAR|nr:hypothetical protein J3R30DRAFT_3484850 [Lentinula aciculospora]